MQNIKKILKSNFKIEAQYVPNLLEEIIETWPVIKTMSMFKQKRNSGEQLQYSLYVLGFHTRVYPDGHLFDIKSLIPYPIVENDQKELFSILAKYTERGTCAEYMLAGSKEKLKLCFDDYLEPVVLRPIPVSVIFDTFIPEVGKPKEQFVEIIKPAVKGRGRPKTKK